jgi:hypothetical protein
MCVLVMTKPAPTYWDFGRGSETAMYKGSNHNIPWRRMLYTLLFITPVVCSLNAYNLLSVLGSLEIYMSCTRGCVISSSLHIFLTENHRLGDVCLRVTAIGRLVYWLWWGETDVSELRPICAYCSSPGDCDCVMVSTETNSLLVYQSALAATGTLAILSAEISLERVGERAKEMRI